MARKAPSLPLMAATDLIADFQRPSFSLCSQRGDSGARSAPIATGIAIKDTTALTAACGIRAARDGPRVRHVGSGRRVMDPVRAMWDAGRLVHRGVYRRTCPPLPSGKVGEGGDDEGSRDESALQDSGGERLVLRGEELRCPSKADGWHCDGGAKGMGWVALRQGCEGDGMGGAVG